MRAFKTFVIAMVSSGFGVPLVTVKFIFELFLKRNIAMLSCWQNVAFISERA
jgi:hypothetical protein